MYLCFLSFYICISASLLERTRGPWKGPGDPGCCRLDASRCWGSATLGPGSWPRGCGGPSPLPRRSLAHAGTPLSGSGPALRWLLVEVAGLGGPPGWRGPCPEQPGLDATARSILRPCPGGLCSFGWKSQFWLFLFQPLHWLSLWLWKAPALRLWWSWGCTQALTGSGPNTLNNWWAALFLQPF